jgi:hypothetical protein
MNFIILTIPEASSPSAIETLDSSSYFVYKLKYPESATWQNAFALPSKNKEKSGSCSKNTDLMSSSQPELFLFNIYILGAKNGGSYKFTTLMVCILLCVIYEKIQLGTVAQQITKKKHVALPPTANKNKC